jgi:nitrogen regulatory protein P-II 1
MKRIEAIIRSEKLDPTVTALQKMGVPATIYESKGIGKGDKYTISYGKGMGTAKMLYSDRKTVVTVIDDEKVNDVINAIRSATSTGTTSAGIIFVSSIDEAITI